MNKSIIYSSSALPFTFLALLYYVREDGIPSFPDYPVVVGPEALKFNDSQGPEVPATPRCPRGPNDPRRHANPTRFRSDRSPLFY